MRLKACWILLLLLMGAAPANAAVIINGLSYDLDQFIGASVTTTAPVDELEGSNWDNPNGVDGVTLGELAAGQFGGDFGDRISLGDTGLVQSLTLTYGLPVLIGSGDSSKFVIFEQSGLNTVTPEGTAFEVSFNGNAFVNASTSGAVSVTGGVIGNGPPGTTQQHQVVLNLLHADFGFLVGQSISTVTIRNLILPLTPNDDDPDFLFAARAGTAPLSEVPEPASLVLFGLGGLGLLATSRRRKARS